MILTTSEESRLLDQRHDEIRAAGVGAYGKRRRFRGAAYERKNILGRRRGWSSSAAAETTGVTDSSRHGTLFPKVLMWRFLSWGCIPYGREFFIV